MSIGMTCLLVFILSLGVLFIAILVIRRQRMLAEKKAQYLACMKQRDYHQRRFKACQVDIEKLRVSYNSLLRDLNLLLIEMGKKKKEIKEILEVLKEESKGVDGQVEQDLTRIIERRKDMLKKDWQEFNGKKTSYLEKLKQAISDRQSMNGYIMRKEEEFRKWSKLEDYLKQLKKEYARMVRNPIIPFGRKKS